MDEYIKREDALKAITWNGLHEPPEVIHLTLLTAQKNIRKIPAADVVSRAEVAIMYAHGGLSRLLELEKETKEKTVKIALLESGIFEKGIEFKTAMNIFEEIEKIATSEGAYDYVSIQEIAELKKKYTE